MAATITAVPDLVFRAGGVVFVRDDDHDNDDGDTGDGGMICFERLLEGIFILICYCRIMNNEYNSTALAIFRRQWTVCCDDRRR